MIVNRLPASAALSGRSLVALASPTGAHPITGGSASPLLIAITVGGTIMALAGVGAALAATSDSKRFTGEKTRLRPPGGAALALVGLGEFLGPDLFQPAQIPCKDRPLTQGSVTVTGPSQDQVFASQDLPLKIDLQGGEIAPVASTSNQEGQGHLHISIDGRLASMTAEADQTLQVPPGKHELEVEYVANDHAPFCKRIADRVRFTVEDAPA